MLSVVPRLPSTRIRQEAAAALREALARVDGGETISVVILEQTAADDVRTSYNGTMDVHKLVYGLERVKHDILSQLSD